MAPKVVQVAGTEPDLSPLFGGLSCRDTMAYHVVLNVASLHEVRTYSWMQLKRRPGIRFMEAAEHSESAAEKKLVTGSEAALPEREQRPLPKGR